MGRPAVGVLVAALVLLCGTAAAVFDGYDGMPRPPGMDQDPTTTYGPKPAVKYANKPAKCIWYGWENGNYPPEGTKNCSSSLWTSLSNSNPVDLAGFMYYVPLDDIYYDPSYNEYLCAIGCFDLSASAPASPPTNLPVADAPGATPLSPAAAPSVVSAPPPVASTTSTPPPSTAPPPPATLFRPPPPAPPLPPAIAPAPASIVMPQSPAQSPAQGPGQSPISTPAASGPGPSVVQTGSGTSTSVSLVLTYIVTLILFISFLV